MQDIWIISSIPKRDGVSQISEIIGADVSEYRISDLAQYLLNPDPVVLEERVIGCKIIYKTRGTGISGLLKRIFKKKDTTYPQIEEMITPMKTPDPEFEDQHLNHHLRKILSIIRPFDPVRKNLSSIDLNSIEDIIPLCEDISKNRHAIDLKGSLREKANYVLDNLCRYVRVSFNRSYLMNGLFELRGYDFSSFDPEKYYKIIKVREGTGYRFCVMSPEGRTLYWIDDNNLVNYLHIFQQAIDEDPSMKEAIHLCMRGEAIALKLFFSRQQDKSYSERYLPRIYRDLLNNLNLRPDELRNITDILNNNQNIVSFNYILTKGALRNKLFTTVSIMHDIRALEPIKHKLPEIYNRIEEIARPSDVGRLYLLDSLRGYQDV